MKILIGKKLKDYENYINDREKFLRIEKENLRKEQEKVKEKLNAFCQDKKHNFIVNVNDYGDITKTCSKCPMTMIVRHGEY